jgi:hypothetical protein
MRKNAAIVFFAASVASAAGTASAAPVADGVTKCRSRDHRDGVVGWMGMVGSSRGICRGRDHWWGARGPLL